MPYPCKYGHSAMESRQYGLKCLRCANCGFASIIQPKTYKYALRDKTINAHYLGRTIKLDTISGDEIFEPYDYVIVDGQESYLCKAKEFERLYTLVDN